METVNKTAITVSTTVKASISKVWEYWNAPEHITNWYSASEDWHAPYAENDLGVGKKFKTTMAAKDGSFSFDFEGVYTKIQEHELIEYELGDGRKVSINFKDTEDGVEVVETFEAESSNPEEMQRTGWQAILDHFKRYTEGN